MFVLSFDKTFAQNRPKTTYQIKTIITMYGMIIPKFVLPQTFVLSFSSQFFFVHIYLLLIDNTC